MVRSYAHLWKRSDCTYRLVLQAPGWETSQVFSNKSLPHIHYLFQTNHFPLQTTNGHSYRRYQAYDQYN